MTLRYPCCEHCAEDLIHDVDTDDHEVPCDLCQRLAGATGPTREVQRLTAERDELLRQLADANATCARVEKVCDAADAFGDEIEVADIRAALEEPS